MPKAYNPPENLSIETVPPNIWLFTISILLLLTIGGVTLVILLSLGLADPPRAGLLKWSATNADDWPLTRQASDFRFYSAPAALPMPPFTLELTADNYGASDSGWGVWIGSWSILVSRERYFSISSEEKPHWAEFFHIRQNGDNKLYLDIQENGTAILRINDEIAWIGRLTISENTAWGVTYYRYSRLCWTKIEIYAEN